MKKSILLTAAVLCITAAFSFAQTEAWRYTDKAGNLVIHWDDGKISTYGKDPTGIEDLEHDPNIAERLYDKHGNRREITQDGRTRIIERPYDPPSAWEKKADRPAREPEKKADVPARKPAGDPKKPQNPK